MGLAIGILILMVLLVGWMQAYTLHVLSRLQDIGRVIMDKLETLTQRVQEQDTVIASATTLLTTIDNELQEALANEGGVDTDRIQALADHIHANTEALASAVLAHTPQAPPAPAPVPEPAPEPAPVDEGTGDQ